MHFTAQQSVRVGNQSYEMRFCAASRFYIHGMGWINLGLRLLLRAIRRPLLAVALLKVCWRFRQRYWYRRFPFLPLPDRQYVRWRMYTAYGDYDFIPPAPDVERYSMWAVSDK